MSASQTTWACFPAHYPRETPLYIRLSSTSSSMVRAYMSLSSSRDSRWTGTVGSQEPFGLARDLLESAVEPVDETFRSDRSSEMDRVMWFSVAANAAQRVRASTVDWAELDQEHLVAALVARDEGAFEWLVRQHWSGMMRVATGLLENKSLATEVVQETWETVVKEIPRFRKESALSTWIYRILVNRARRVGKKEARTIPLSSFCARNDDEGSTEDDGEFTINGRWRSPVHGWRMIDPQTEAINKEGVTRLAKGLELLPDRQRIIVTLRDVEGLGSKEVCEMLGITEANQRLLLHRGRTRLRRMLEAEEKEAQL